MKLILLLLLLFPINCKAEETYSNYYFYEETENYYEETNLLKREEKKLYLNYKYEVSEEGYYPLGEAPDNLPFIDKEDYIIIDDEKSKKSTYLYIDDFENIKYVKILNFNGDLTKIDYFITRKNNEVAVWDLQYINCFLGEIIRPESIILLKLRNTYHFENFKVIISILSTSKKDFSFDLGISEDNITYKYFNINLPNEILNNEHIFYFTNILEETGIKYENSITLYKYYNLNKVYIETYTEEPLLDHYHDLEQFKTIYTYYKRDKLNEEVPITNEKPQIGNNQEETLDITPKNNILEQTIDSETIFEEKIIKDDSSSLLNEQLKLMNTSKDKNIKDKIIIEKEKKEPKQETKKLSFNLFLLFVSITIIKFILKKKELI